MINKNELKTDNKVGERGNHRVYEVQQITHFGAVVKYWSCGENEVIPFDKLIPIKITKDILIDSGYRLNNSEVIIPDSDGDFIMQYFDHTKRYHYTAGDGCRNGIGVEYIHQLQNLYFAIMGKELYLTSKIQAV